MVLFRMLRDDVIDLRDALKLCQEFIGHGGINRVQQSRLLTAFNEISVIAGSVRKGDKRVK